jgi:hypothetical protein
MKLPRLFFDACSGLPLFEYEERIKAFFILLNIGRKPGNVWLESCSIVGKSVGFDGESFV